MHGKMKQKKRNKILLVIGGILLVLGIVFGLKTFLVLNKISGGNANIFSSLVRSLPGVSDELKGEESGRINILLLGMRGVGVEGGGTLADTIMVASIHPKAEGETVPKASLTSIPRDLYVTVPGTNKKRKIKLGFTRNNNLPNNCSK